MTKLPSKSKLNLGKYRPWAVEEPLGKALRDAYEHVRQEPLPEDWKKLLERMREQERKTPPEDD